MRYERKMNVVRQLGYKSIDRQMNKLAKEQAYKAIDRRMNKLAKDLFSSRLTTLF